jgi:hypothetical protein
MQIKLNTNIDSVARVNTVQPKASRPVDRQAALSEFEESQALEARMMELPETRSEKVQEAKRLIGDPAYPPRETIQRLATLLAINENSEPETSEN